MWKLNARSKAHLYAFGSSLLLAAAAQADYSAHPETEKFISEFSRKHEFDKAELHKLFGQVEKKQAILEAIARPAEKVLSWKEYRNIFIQAPRIDGGVEFWRGNAKTLQRAEQEYGVPASIIVAIIGVETRYGTHAGNYRVIDALSTLGFDYPPRSTFFRKELEHFLLLAREQKQDPLNLKGSYAGAMGYGQFMPSSYRSYAVDFDGDAFVDIWNNPVDAVGSVANYLSRHGWQRDKPIAIRAKLGENTDKNLFTSGISLDRTFAELNKGGVEALDPVAADESLMAFKLDGEHGAEFWLGLKNFYAITRYNRSQLYAMAVYQLSESINQAYQSQADAAATPAPEQATTSKLATTSN